MQNCPGCDASGYCPDIRVGLTGLPEYFRVEIRDNQGNPVAIDDPEDMSRLLTWTLGETESYGIFFSRPGEMIPEGSQSVGIEVTEVDP